MTRWLAPVFTVTVAMLVLPPARAALTVAPAPDESVYVNVALIASPAIGSADAGLVEPDVLGETPSVIIEPLGGAGMSSVAVNVVMPFGATSAEAGDSVTVVAASVA